MVVQPHYKELIMLTESKNEQQNNAVQNVQVAFNLNAWIEKTVHSFLTEQPKAKDVYNLVISEVELPLLTSIMHHARGNQSLAAKMLGLSRGTLRKKLKTHGLLNEKSI